MQIGQRFIPVRTPVPLNAWAMHSNELFYRADDPLIAFRTLGSADPLLPKAFAAHLDRIGAGTVHEIGTGNFFFARKLLQHAPGIGEYRAFDFSDSSFRTHERSLPPQISFTHCPAAQVRMHVAERGARLIGVELCDDLPTEFWTSHGGKFYELWTEMEVDASLRLPTKAQDIVNSLSRGGLLSSDARRMSARLDRELTADSLASAIQTARWDDLANYDPGLLKAIRYTGNQFMQSALERVFETSWCRMPVSFRPLGEQILKAYGEQLLSVELEGQVVHLPTSAITLLWQFRDLPGVSIDFFDYGYASPAERIAPYMLFQGQVSAPVNFGIMRTAAELMGYKVSLEKDRDFISSVTGEDAMVIGRVLGLDLRPETETEALLHHFGAAARELCPDADVNENTIRALRVRRSAVERTAASLGKRCGYRDGAYHFRAELPS